MPFQVSGSTEMFGPIWKDALNRILQREHYFLWSQVGTKRKIIYMYMYTYMYICIYIFI